MEFGSEHVARLLWILFFGGCSEAIDYQRDTANQWNLPRETFACCCRFFNRTSNEKNCLTLTLTEGLVDNNFARGHVTFK